MLRLLCIPYELGSVRDGGAHMKSTVEVVAAEAVGGTEQSGR